MTDRPLIYFQNGQPTDEMFTHSVFGTFNITRLKAVVKKTGLVPVTFDVQLSGVFEDMLKSIDMNPVRVAQLHAMDVSLLLPGIGCQMENGESVIVDGFHRIQVWLDRKMPVRAHMLEWSMVKDCMIRVFELKDGKTTEISAEQLLKMTWGKHSLPPQSGV